ncbi:unnamed protein product [Sympodiomycopsis kandeliae]
MQDDQATPQPPRYQNSSYHGHDTETSHNGSYQTYPMTQGGNYQQESHHVDDYSQQSQQYSQQHRPDMSYTQDVSAGYFDQYDGQHVGPMAGGHIEDHQSYNPHDGSQASHTGYALRPGMHGSTSGLLHSESKVDLSGYPTPGQQDVQLHQLGPSYPPEQYSSIAMPTPMPAPSQPWQAFATPGTVLANAMPQQGDQYYPGGGSGLQRGMSRHDVMREKILKRREVRQIELTRGNLVIDVPVPPSICKSSQDREMTTCRYTAATCDPDNFSAERYALRPDLLGRETELAIVLTSYNEDEKLLCKTLNNTIKNIQKLCEKKNSSTWGPDGWKKVVICIVADGRTKADARFLKVLSLLGVFHEGVMKSEVLKKQVTAHIFEFTSQVIVDANGSVKVGAVPIQIVFCLKEKNQKKINSHRWFFRAFCQQLQPNVCMLLDVGTKPGTSSLVDLWRAFKKSPNVGGACGEIRTDVGTVGSALVNPLVASQNFEYKMSNILDKPLESIFGFISVLPGAFSAYRWKALQGVPLEAYFKGEALHSGEIENPSSFTSNMYLAEDRILCFEICTKRKEKWVLRYVKSAFAVTDVPTEVAELISQRRRWNNGSLFAAFYAVAHFGRIWSSGHGPLRKLVLLFQALYNFVQLIFGFTALANFFLAFYFLTNSATSDPDADAFAGQGEAVQEVLSNIFIALIVVTLVLSLGNRPAGSKWVYTSVIVFFSGIMGVSLYCTGWSVYRAFDAAGLLSSSGYTASNANKLLHQAAFRDIVISLLATYVMYLVTSLIHLDPWHMITSFVQYLLLMPMFVIIINIYSMCNLHDVSWGTKGDNGGSLGSASSTSKKGKDGQEIVEVKVPNNALDAEEMWRSIQSDLSQPRPQTSSKRNAQQKQSDHAANFRTHFVLSWLAVNAALVILFTSTWWKHYIRNHLYKNSKGPVVDPYMSTLFWVTAGLSAIRSLGSILYILFRLFRIS